MLGLLPSVYGLFAAVLFAALFLLSMDADRLMEAVGFALLSFAYLLRHIPKVLVFSFVDIFAHLAFLAGAVMVAYSVADRMDLIQ